MRRLAILLLMPLAAASAPVLPGSVHVPPTSGVPPRPLKRSSAMIVSHASRLPFVPASGGPVSTTVTVADSFGQGKLPPTVYV